MSNDEEKQKKEYTCNKCGGLIEMKAIVGEPVEPAEVDPHYPIALVLGCANCSLIISNRLIITAMKKKEE